MYNGYIVCIMNILFSNIQCEKNMDFMNITFTSIKLKLIIQEKSLSFVHLIQINLFNALYRDNVKSLPSNYVFRWNRAVANRQIVLLLRRSILYFHPRWEMANLATVFCYSKRNESNVTQIRKSKSI